MPYKYIINNDGIDISHLLQLSTVINYIRIIESDNLIITFEVYYKYIGKLNAIIRLITALRIH